MGQVHDTSPKNSLLLHLYSMSNHELQQGSYTSNHNAFKFLSKTLVSPPPKYLAHTVVYTSKYLTIFSW